MIDHKFPGKLGNLLFRWVYLPLADQTQPMKSIRLTPREIRIGLLFTFCIILATIFLRPCTPPVPEARGTADSVFYWKNKHNQLVASIRGRETDFAAYSQRLLDSIAKIYSTKSKYIQEVVTATIEGHANIPAVPGTLRRDTIWWGTPVYLDSGSSRTWNIINTSQKFHSRWYDADVKVGENPYLHLSTYDTMTALWKIVKEGSIFNRKKYLQYDISFADTSRRVAGIRTYRRQDIPKEVSVNLESELFYLDRQIHPFISIGLERAAGRFTGGLYAGKDLSSSTLSWQSPWIGKARLNFKLVKF